MNEIDIYEAQQRILIMDYDRAYYKWLFGPESEREHNEQVLKKYRSMYFNT